MDVSQEQAATLTPTPTTAAAFLRALRHFSAADARWAGGVVDMDPPLDEDQARALGELGSWAALLLPKSRVLGHWVVVAGWTTPSEGKPKLILKDPIGHAYEMELEDFSNLTYTMTFIFQTG